MISKSKTIILSVWILVLTCNSLKQVMGETEGGSNYYKINNYLEKEVDSDDLDANLSKAKEWLASLDSSPSGDTKLIKTLQFFIMLGYLKDNITASCSSFGFKILEKIEEGLWDDETRQHLSGDYPLRRLDRILEECAFNQFELCDPEFFNKSIKLNRCLKRSAYNEINDYLIENEYSDGVDANINKLSELLQKTVEEKSHPNKGALSDALKQILSLVSLIDKHHCNEEGYQILMRNNLALPFEKSADNFPERRIDNLIKHYSLTSATVCQFAFPEIFTKLIQQLDMHSSRSLRVLLSESLLIEPNANEEAQLQFKQEFTTPELVTAWEAKKNESSSGKEFWVFGSKMMLKVIDNLVASQDENFIITTTLVDDDESAGEQRKAEVDQDKLVKSYEKYLEMPCEKYLNTVSRFFVHLDFYKRLFYRYKTPTQLDYFSDESLKSKYSGLKLGEGLTKLCQRIVAGKPDNLKEMFYAAVKLSFGEIATLY